MNYGVWLYPVAPADRLVEAIVQLDRAGVDEVWIADEGVAREPLSIFAAASQRTRSIRFGVGITSPLLRHPGAVAAAASTVDELCDGRLTLGWGVGGHESLGPFGLSTDRPVAVVRDAIRTARAVMNRESGHGYEPPTHASPARFVPQFVGARGPQMNRMASREADGVFLSGFADDDLADVLAHAHAHRRVSVALYMSVRFTTPADSWSWEGSPPDLAARLRRVAERFRPDSLGLALVDGDDLDAMVDGALATIAELRAA